MFRVTDGGAAEGDDENWWVSHTRTGGLVQLKIACENDRNNNLRLLQNRSQDNVLVPVPVNHLSSTVHSVPVPDLFHR